MITGIWVHAWDLMDNGVDETLGELADLGYSHVSLNVRYVEERQAYPGTSIIYRNKKRRVYMSSYDSIFWEPDPKYYKDLPAHLILKPRTNTDNLLSNFIESANTHGIKPVFWLPVLRWDYLAKQYPELAVRDIYGGVSGYKAQFLCPNNPYVRRLVKSIVEELSTRYNIGEIELDYIRYPEPIVSSSNITYWFLQLPCFCKHCERKMLEEGIDPSNVKRELTRLTKTFIEAEDQTGATSPYGCYGCLERFSLYLTKALADNEVLRKWILFCSKSIASLIEEIREVALEYGVDISADLKPPMESWLVGQDYELISKLIGTAKIMLYTEPFHNPHEIIPFELALAKKYISNVIMGVSIWPPSTPQTIRRDVFLGRKYVSGYYAYAYGWAPRTNLLEFIKSIHMGDTS